MRAHVVVMLLLTAACKTTPDKPVEPEPVTQPVTAAPDAPALLLSLKRTPCFGRCPVYTVELYADGRLHFEGDANTRERGAHEGKLTPEQVAAVTARVEASDFATWKTSYETHTVTDLPGAVLTWKGKTIRHYHGDESAPTDLMALETDLDVLLGTSVWIRGEEASDR